MHKLITILMLVCWASMGANWYVDSSAVGTDAGTSWANAWTSVSNVVWGVGGVTAGDTLYISGGTTTKTYNGQLTVGDVGTVANRITIKPGAGEASPNPIHSGIVILKGTFTEPAGNPPPSDPGNTRSGILGSIGSNLTIDGSDGSGNVRLVVDSCQRGVYFDYSTNLTIRYVNVTNSYGGFVARSATNVLIEYCDARTYGGGIRVAGYGNPQSSSVIRYNRLETKFYDGISVDGGIDVIGNWVRKSNNEEWTTPSHFSHPDGIVLGRGDVRILYNRIDGFEQNIYMDAYADVTAMFPMTNVWIVSNVITTNAPDPVTNLTYAIVFYPQDWEINTVRIVGNTMPNHGIRVSGPVTHLVKNLTVKNNILGAGYAEITVALDLPTWQSDYNRFSAISCWFISGGIYDLPTWKTTTSQDAHTTAGDPLLVSPTDWRLKIISPCIDAGVNLGSDYQTGLKGTTWPNPTTTTRTGAWDIGAYESQSSGAKVTTPGKITVIGKVTL